MIRILLLSISLLSTGQRVIAEYLANSAPASTEHKYVYTTYIDDRCLFIDRTASGSLPAGQEELFYYHCNNLFSVQALTNQSGVVQERYAYDAYGNLTIHGPDSGGTLGAVLTTPALGNMYCYTGRRLDPETKLFYYRARYYDSQLGRFINRDPLEYIDGLSLYMSYFVPNSVDPEGTYSFCQTVETPPTVTGDCGGARARMQWSLITTGEVNLNEVDGHIVQHVTINQNIMNCDGSLNYVNTSSYYEAWEVRDGRVYGVFPWIVRHDEFRIADGCDDETRGTITMTGSVAYMQGFDLQQPPWAARGEEGHIAIASDLRTLEPGPPVGWTGGAFHRTLMVEWNCCPCEEGEEDGSFSTDISDSIGWHGL